MLLFVIKITIVKTVRYPNKVTPVTSQLLSHLICDHLLNSRNSSMMSWMNETPMAFKPSSHTCSQSTLTCGELLTAHHVVYRKGERGVDLPSWPLRTSLYLDLLEWVLWKLCNLQEFLQEEREMSTRRINFKKGPNHFVCEQNQPPQYRLPLPYGTALGLA